jgi:hypothetical protein
MLRKIFPLTVAVCVATLLMSADARAWGGGSWNRSGSASYTGRYGNTYSRNYSSSGSFAGGGYHGGGYYGGGYHYRAGGGYYGGGFHAGYVSTPYGAAYAAGVYRRPIW